MQGEAEDADGLTPVKDDNAAMRSLARRTCVIILLDCYIYRNRFAKQKNTFIKEKENGSHTDRNPRFLMEQIKAQNAVDGQNHFPAFYVAYGTEDHLIGANRSIAAALK